jgi:hypothetical protein
MTNRLYFQPDERRGSGHNLTSVSRAGNEVGQNHQARSLAATHDDSLETARWMALGALSFEALLRRWLGDGRPAIAHAVQQVVANECRDYFTVAGYDAF